MARSAVTGAVSAAVVAAVAAGPSGEGLNVECRTENGLSMVGTDADDGAETLRAHAESSGRKPREQASGASNTTAGPPPSRPEADERSAAIGGTRPSRKFQGLNRLPFDISTPIYLLFDMMPHRLGSRLRGCRAIRWARSDRVRLPRTIISDDRPTKPVWTPERSH